MMMPSALPETHPPRLTISWITEERSGVCASGTGTSSVVHEGGTQVTLAEVRVRPVRLFLLDMAAELSDASAWMNSVVASERFSFGQNWTHAPVIVAPCGIATFVKRRPTA